MTISSFSFVFALNNAERFYGCTLMVLGIGLIELYGEYISPYLLLRKLLAFLLITCIVKCIYLSKERAYKSPVSCSKKYDSGIPLAVFILLSYFTIRIMNFYVPAFKLQSAAQAWGVFTLIPVMLCILMKIVFKYSIWTMCNLFFISSVMSHVMRYVGFTKSVVFLLIWIKSGYLYRFI